MPLSLSCYERLSSEPFVSSFLSPPYPKGDWAIEIWSLGLLPTGSKTLVEVRRPFGCAGCIKFAVASGQNGDVKSDASCKKSAMPYCINLPIAFILNLFSSWVCMKYLPLDVKQPSINQSFLSPIAWEEFRNCFFASLSWIW